MTGKASDIAAIIDVLREAGVEVGWNGCTYPRRDGTGVSAYAKVTAPQHDNDEEPTHGR
ncbi:hypothetical protein ACFXON_24390 [Bacillus subtilis]